MAFRIGVMIDVSLELSNNDFSKRADSVDGVSGAFSSNLSLSKGWRFANWACLFVFPKWRYFLVIAAAMRLFSCCGCCS